MNWKIRKLLGGPNQDEKRYDTETGKVNDSS